VTDDRPFEPSPEAELGADMMRMHEGWEELGIDADDFLKCARCHRFIKELVEGTEPPLQENELCMCDTDPNPPPLPWEKTG
jgi:hypothetical protein